MRGEGAERRMAANNLFMQLISRFRRATLFILASRHREKMTTHQHGNKGKGEVVNSTH